MIKNRIKWIWKWPITLKRRTFFSLGHDSYQQILNFFWLQKRKLTSVRKGTLKDNNKIMQKTSFPIFACFSVIPLPSSIFKLRKVSLIWNQQKIIYFDTHHGLLLRKKITFYLLFLVIFICILSTLILSCFHYPSFYFYWQIIIW